MENLGLNIIGILSILALHSVNENDEISYLGTKMLLLSRIKALSNFNTGEVAKTSLTSQQEMSNDSSGQIILDREQELIRLIQCKLLEPMTQDSPDMMASMIPQLRASVEEMDDYGNALRMGFSKKDISELPSQASEYKEQLLIAKKRLEEEIDRVPVFETSWENVEDRRELIIQSHIERLPIWANYFVQLLVVDLKLCIVEQAHLIAESNRCGNCPLDETQLNTERREKIDADLRKLKFPSPHYFDITHLTEDVAALFSDDRGRLQIHLTSRHSEDQLLLSTLLEESCSTANNWTYSIGYPNCAIF